MSIGGSCAERQTTGTLDVVVCRLAPVAAFPHKFAHRGRTPPDLEGFVSLDCFFLTLHEFLVVPSQKGLQILPSRLLFIFCFFCFVFS